MTITAPHK